MTKGFASAGVFSSHAAFTAASFQLSTENQYGLPIIQVTREHTFCYNDTFLTDALLAAFKIASVYATTLGMTTLGSVLNETSDA